MDLVDDTVQTGHQLGRKGQVRVGSRIREAYFDAAGFSAWHDRDTDGGRAVAGGVGQHDRCFIARHQTLVGVGGRVGEGVDGLGVLDDAADGEQSQSQTDRRTGRPANRLTPSLARDWWQCMPEPLSPNIGFGMKVTVLL